MKKLILGFLVIGNLNLLCQDNVGIGTTSPNASAILDLTSTDKGFLLPRMTTEQRDVITEPATGLIIFNTAANRYEYNSGTPSSPVWTSLVSNGITSVGSIMPDELSVSNSPLTANGILTVNWNAQPANRVFAGPANGTDAAPAFRVLTSDDIPGLNASKITTGILPVANGGTGASALTGILKGDGTNAASGITNTTGNITFWSDANTINGSADLTWDNINKRLGVGTNSPAASIDINGDFKLGTGGTAITKIIKSSVTITGVLGITTGVYKPVNVTVSGAMTNGTVIVNPRTSIHVNNSNMTFIAYSYVSSSNTVTIVFGGTSASGGNVSNKTFDITVIQ